MAKRFHVNLSVEKIDASIAFYSNLFGTPPAVVKPDYAKWMLDDPRVNFAISTRGGKPGVDHLGIQVDDADELNDLAARLHAAGEATLEQVGTTCCYAKSDKNWVHDPQGLAWETFRTLGSATTYGDPEAAPTGTACCTPAAKAAPSASSSCCAA